MYVSREKHTEAAAISMQTVAKMATGTQPVTPGARSIPAIIGAKPARTRPSWFPIAMPTARMP
ncbi:hypothetical protein ASPU41_17060 [Arthrobacter sp. U41]|nr:hypothetical protein ASPU41_17060 [Arthrobacter sp. U41]